MIPAGLETLRDFLLGRGMKLTPQRRTVLEAFEETTVPVRCEELLGPVPKKDPAIGLSTVYRTMKLLVQAGFAYRIHQGDGVFLHAKPCSCGRSIKMRCTSCGTVVFVQCPQLSHHLEEALALSGCSLTSQHHRLTGLCAQCREAG